MHRIRVALAVTCVALGAVACAGPTPAAPSASPIAGAWIANASLAGASGGECVGADLQQAIGRRDRFLMALAGGSAINATITSEGTGTMCAYVGSNVNGAVNLTMTSCHSSRVLGVPCGSGGTRDLQLTAASLQATADSRTGTGSGVDRSTWSVSPAGSSQVLGTLNLQIALSWVYLGLPSPDYHEFTGTVFPGYEDGVITIPADPNPWCLPCGWFRLPSFFNEIQEIRSTARFRAFRAYSVLTRILRVPRISPREG